MQQQYKNYDKCKLLLCGACWSCSGASRDTQQSATKPAKGICPALICAIDIEECKWIVEFKYSARSQMGTSNNKQRRKVPTFRCSPIRWCTKWVPARRSMGNRTATTKTPVRLANICDRTDRIKYITIIHIFQQAVGWIRASPVWLTGTGYWKYAILLAKNWATTWTIIKSNCNRYKGIVSNFFRRAAPNAHQLPLKYVCFVYFMRNMLHRHISTMVVPCLPSEMDQHRWKNMLESRRTRTPSPNPICTWIFSAKLYRQQNGKWRRRKRRTHRIWAWAGFRVSNIIFHPINNNNDRNKMHYFSPFLALTRPPVRAPPLSTQMANKR